MTMIGTRALWRAAKNRPTSVYHRVGLASSENNAFLRSERIFAPSLLQTTTTTVQPYSTSVSKNCFSSCSSLCNSTIQKKDFSTAAATAKNDCEFLANAELCGYSELEGWLTQGGDDRSLILPKTGANKYHIMPKPINKDAIFRGSCTCNAPTERGYLAASELYGKEFEGKSSDVVDEKLSEIFENQRQRIASSLELPEGTEVVLCPSGSDAEYLPIVMARMLCGSSEGDEVRPMLNVVTQLKEIGAGSSVASGGLYFSTHAPLSGRLADSEGRLAGFDDIEEISIPARERNGDVIDGSKKALELAAASEDGTYTIIHGVFGGKTGLRDSVMPGSASIENSMGVIDACQGRFSMEELHSWLEQDSIVLFTASKFYQAPPFCGAVFIPKRIAERLSQVTEAPKPKEMFDSLSGFLTDKELSPCLASWKPLLKKNTSNNIGLALRWEAGLAGMEALGNTPDPERVAAVEEWAEKVTDMVQAEPALDAWCVERSIISVRLSKGDSSWRSMSELRDVYRLMSLDLSSVVPADASPEEKRSLAVCCNLGQPVDVAESHAILRIALGSESLAAYIDDKGKTLEEDRMAVQKLASLAKYYDHLMESGI